MRLHAGGFAALGYHLNFLFRGKNGDEKIMRPLETNPDHNLRIEAPATPVGGDREMLKP
jgi:hypothetical protein